ncbi:MAG TPA: protein kinase [Planctomycetota bacterium]|nr:protein kinase [Planctomycetota bacterium]
MSTGAEEKPLNDVRRFLEDDEADLAGPDSPLGEIAVSRGYVTEAQLEECLEEQKRLEPHVLLGELLLRRKYLTGEQLLRTLAAQKKPEPAPQLPEGVKIGKYSLVREIGRGGMGVVYEAEDPDLRRRVALKVLKEDTSDPTAAERLKREAAIAAQLRHPNIIAVHEIGTTKTGSGPSLPFIAMEFIEGRTLADLIEGRTSARKDLLRILEDVSRAVAHAHGQGVIHRDLKPANVIVDQTGRCFLGDFGIARAASFETRLTEARFIVGTPEYMAPEQAEDRPDAIGPATDIHALGVMLYEILTGQRPFRAESPLALLRKIVTDEPVAPSRLVASVESDLEVICLKALEKEGDRRYASADAFADDLERFRLGKSISVRPAGLVTRLWRRLLRRKKGAAILASSAAVVLAIVASLGAWGRRERNEALRQLNQRMETTLRATLELRRAGDLARMKGFARESLEACAAAAARYPALAEPHALLGRMHRVLMDDAAAMTEQDLALRLDPGCERARYERLVLRSRVLRRREDELTDRAWRGLGQKLLQDPAAKVRPEEISVPSKDQLSKADPEVAELRRLQEEDLRILEESSAGTLRESEVACARGLTGRSRTRLREALAKEPALEEAVEALALMDMQEGHFEQAVAVWSAGIQVDKGCLTHLQGRGESRLRWGQQTVQRGDDPSETLIAAVGDFTLVLEKEPRLDAALRNRGLAHFLLGLSIGWTRLEDATRQFQAASEDLGRALELNPAPSETWMWRGVVRAALSAGRMFHLEDPIPACKLAMADLTEAIRRDPQGDEPHCWRALARIPWAIQLGLKREDPEPLYRDAMTDLDQALRLNPGRGESWLARANLQSAWAGFQLTKGKDASDILKRAAADLDIAIRKIPTGVEAPGKRGRIELQLAALPGEDAEQRCAAAARFFETVLARNPKNAVGLAGRGEAKMRQAAEAARRGDNPSALFDAAFRDLDEAVKSDSPAKIVRAEAYVRRGQWKEAAGQEGDSDYLAAVTDTKSALEANALATEAWIWQGRARTLSAGFRPVPMIHYQEAINDFNRVLFFAPDHLQALKFRADAHRRRAVLKAARRQEAGADFQAALTDYEHALRLQPGLERELHEAMSSCKAGLK